MSFVNAFVQLCSSSEKAGALQRKILKICLGNYLVSWFAEKGRCCWTAAAGSQTYQTTMNVFIQSGILQYFSKQNVCASKCYVMDFFNQLYLLYLLVNQYFEPGLTNLPSFLALFLQKKKKKMRKKEKQEEVEEEEGEEEENTGIWISYICVLVCVYVCVCALSAVVSLCDPMK